MTVWTRRLYEDVLLRYHFLKLCYAVLTLNLRENPQRLTNPVKRHAIPGEASRFPCLQNFALPGVILLTHRRLECSIR